MTFKENCPDVRNSKVFDIIDELQSWNAEVHVVDEWADKAEVKAIAGLTITALDQLDNMDAIIVAVGHSAFKALKADDFKKISHQNSPVFGDVKSLFDREELAQAGFDVFRL